MTPKEDIRNLIARAGLFVVIKSCASIKWKADGLGWSDLDAAPPPSYVGGSSYLEKVRHDVAGHGETVVTK